MTTGIDAVIQLHRLREVLALWSGSRDSRPVMPDINGEYESDVERARLALEPTWFPAVENRGEGVFLQSSAERRKHWLDRAAVVERLSGSRAGHVSGRRTERASDISRRAVHPASHALASPHPVAGNALRLPSELDPRADLRGPPKRNATESCSTPELQTPRGRSAV